VIVIVRVIMIVIMMMSYLVCVVSKLSWARSG
jgi:hypothetical protein